MSVFEELKWRGLVYDASEGAEAHLAKGPVTVYIGFDPTAASLHVGTLVQILGLARMQRYGHRPIGLVGGGTGLIGDPSGKTAERQLLTAEKVAENVAGIRTQLEPFLDFDHPENGALLIDNAEWLTTVKMIDFLRDVGKHFSLGAMLAKESVKRRLESESGISYTEFSYLLLQSWDFLVLHERYGCTLQMGGSDQWGNVTAGIDLVRRMAGKSVHGLVQPLITNAAGTKFGKTESGTVWLDPELTSPYRFYQFWYNTSDADVVDYLRYFTHLERETIAELEHAAATEPHARAAQKRLAAEVTAMVHGETAADRALRASEVLFGGTVDGLGADEVYEIFDDVPSSALDASSFDELPLVELMATTELTPSKGAARRLIKSGGVYLNNRRVSDEHTRVRRDDFLEGRVLVLRKGQKQYHLVTLGV